MSFPCKLEKHRDCDCCGRCRGAPPPIPCAACGCAAEYDVNGTPICRECWTDLPAAEQLELAGAEIIDNEW